MYRVSKIERQKAALYKLLHNGYRFAVIQSGDIVKCYRYELDAQRNTKAGQEVKQLSSMIENLGKTQN